MRSDPTDVHVGRRLQFFRLRAGLSQTRVGKHLGVTFQQIQKYEKGATRISAGRLLTLSRLLGIAVQDFYDGPSGVAGALSRENEAPLPSKLDHEIFQLVSQIDDGKIKRRVRDLLAALVANEDEVPSPRHRRVAPGPAAPAVD